MGLVKQIVVEVLVVLNIVAPIHISVHVGVFVLTGVKVDVLVVPGNVKAVVTDAAVAAMVIALVDV